MLAFVSNNGSKVEYVVTFTVGFFEPSLALGLELFLVEIYSHDAMVATLIILSPNLKIKLMMTRGLNSQCE